MLPAPMQFGIESDDQTFTLKEAVNLEIIVRHGCRATSMPTPTRELGGDGL